MYIVIEKFNPLNFWIECNENGETKFFLHKKEAEEYSVKNCQNGQVVEVK